MRKIFLLVLSITLFFIFIPLASSTNVTDSHGVTMNVLGLQTGQDGVIINTSCQFGTRILSSNMLRGGVPYNRTWIMDNSSTLDSGECIGGNCTYNNKPLLAFGKNVYVLFGMDNNATQYNYIQSDITSFPIGGTNVNWQQGYLGGALYSQYLFVISNITTSCEDTFFYNYNSTTYDMTNETFQVNFSSDSAPTLANLSFNGTNYSATIIDLGSNKYLLKKSLILPKDEVGEKYFSFNFVNGSGYTNSSPRISTNVNQLLFGLCNSTLTTKYLNLSFKDESTSLFINASLPSSTFTYWSAEQSTNRSYSLVNNTKNYEYKFCGNNPITSKSSIQYESVDYPQRLYQDTLTLTNVATNKTLYLLSSTDGIYVTFQVQNANTEQTISGVSVTANRTIGSEVVTVALGTTDASGSVTFWLNPDFSHTLLFQKSGYDSFTTSIFPTQTSYTISMTTGTSTTTSTDYTKGVSYLLAPKGGDKVASLSRNTAYNFTYTLSSSYWDISSFGFNLFYGNGSLIGTISSSNNGGSLGITANTLNESYMKMNFFYVVNSTYYNGTRTWYVESTPSSFSILYFFDDLSLYINAGMFGIDDFGRIILSFFIIVMVIGGMAMRYGVQNEAMIMGMLFGLVYFLDIGIQLIPQIKFAGTAIPHFVTILTGLLLMAFLIKEESR